ncbi:flagellar hook assembly protein FlgD [Bacillus massiliglaciei]|uniref:flagellar hook assembly protein FlgD n=1 Tax=Bacillus massiliglaciei TaxID=1816693 RepID=UPI000A92B4C6|nr:flagellar hook assembly protein FlgD [Bacillus massiliglaciei]
MTSIDTSLLLPSNQTETRKTGDNLGKDDFLKLLITQLQNQDPSNPMDNTEFIAQMATFSTLEQMMNIGTKIDELKSSNDQKNLVQYNSFVGKEVKWHSLDENSNEQPNIKEGTGRIASIQYKGDAVYFFLEDGTKLEPGNISEIKADTPINNLSTGSELIGRKVTWLDEAGSELSGMVKSVLMSEGKLKYEIDDENHSKLSSDQFIKVSSV